MAFLRLLQASCFRCSLPVLLLLAGSGFLVCRAHQAGDGPELTPRQREILTEMRRHRPEGAPAEGVWMTDIWDADAGFSALVNFSDGPGNAAACFKRLEELYPAEKDLLESRDAADAAGTDALLEAAGMGECRFIPEYYPPFVSTEAAQPDFQVLRIYLRALLDRAEQAEQRGRAAEAERCLQAALICGKHLTDDKPSALVYVTGLIFRLRGAQAYAGFLAKTGSTARAEAARRHAETAAMLIRAYMWKANTAMGEFENFACLPALMEIAAGDREVFWRKEAVVRLAAVRYGIPADGGRILRSPVYERMADAALAAAAADDPDPTVRQLAVWAVRHLKPPGYDALEHSFSGP